jgi:NhaP-type Na+/H+ and K+/H+ antiporter
MPAQAPKAGRHRFPALADLNRDQPLFASIFIVVIASLVVQG